MVKIVPFSITQLFKYKNRLHFLRYFALFYAMTQRGGLLATMIHDTAGQQQALIFTELKWTCV